MTIWGAIGHQLHRPNGMAGRMVGQAMRLVNARPNALAIAALCLEPTSTVLELGCGPGDGIRMMAATVTYGRIYGLDRSMTVLAQARALNRVAIASGVVRLFQGSFDQLPFASGSVDRILAVNVAYFWKDADAVLREARRVLRPGGVLSLYVTDITTMQKWRFADPQTHRLFDRDDLGYMLRHGGFRDEAIAIAKISVFPGVAGMIATVDARRVPAPRQSSGQSRL